MRKAAWTVIGLSVAGLIALVITAVTTTTTRAFTIGVFSTMASPPVRAGETACQRPIVVPPDGAFDRVDFEVGNYHEKGGPALDVSVHSLDHAFAPRRGLLPAGYPDVGEQQRHVVRVGHVPAGATIKVCFHNRGPKAVALFGTNDGAATASSAYIDDRAIGMDIDVVLRRPARSFATLLPAIADRASLFRPPWVSPALYYVLLALLAIGVPILLVRAVQRLA